MAIQLGTDVRNARLDQIETTVGTSAYLQIRSGTQPADCQAGTSGTLIWEGALPSDWMAGASGASKAKAGSWTGTAGTSGTAGHFRLYNNGKTVCSMQGACGTSGSDLNLDNTSINAGQTVTVNTFTLNEANA